MHESEPAHIVAIALIGISDEHLGAAIDVPDGLAERSRYWRKLTPYALYFKPIKEARESTPDLSIIPP